DFDGDGHLDLAVAVNDTGFAVPQGSGATKLGQIVLIFSPADPHDQLSWLTVPLTNSQRPNDDLGITDMVVADFDGVNGPDIAFVSNEPSSGGATKRRFIFMFLNPGPAQARNDLSWGTPRSPVPGLGSQPPFVEFDVADAGQIFAADVDGDGDMD